MEETDRQANELLDRLVKQYAAAERITEELKANDQMAWVQAMNNIRNRTEEVVLPELIDNTMPPLQSEQGAFSISQPLFDNANFAGGFVSESPSTPVSVRLSFAETGCWRSVFFILSG